MSGACVTLERRYKFINFCRKMSREEIASKL
jgi:hypothetical protein